MTRGSLYEIFLSDGAASSSLGIFLRRDEGLPCFAVFLVDGFLTKYHVLWYTFREVYEV